MPPPVSQLNLVVRDMAATLAFYRRLGWTVETTPGDEHAEVAGAGPLRIEFDTADSARLWDGGFPGATGGSTVIGVALPTRDAVDALHAELTAAGHPSRQRPYDAFWGARYAIVEDPDGNPVGLMSPGDDARRRWPPQPPPR